MKLSQQYVNINKLQKNEFEHTSTYSTLLDSSLSTHNDAYIFIQLIKK